MKNAYFRPELFRFLKELRGHNTREWFLANRKRYEAHVRQPFLRFIADFAPALRRILPRFGTPSWRSPRRAWKAAASGAAFRKTWTSWGESLKRPPRGYDPEHPFVEDLKRKDFVVTTPFTERAACAPGFLDSFAEACGEAAPFVRFLTRPVGLAW